MKKAILIFGIAVCAFAFFIPFCSKALSAHAREAYSTVIRWTGLVFDFGEIRQKTPVSHTFKFTNAGDEPIVISSVRASCGCTVTSYSKEPVPPGSEGFVKATYDAARVGVFSKTITVNANIAEGSIDLTIKGTVVP